MHGIIHIHPRFLESWFMKIKELSSINSVHGAIEPKVVVTFRYAEFLRKSGEKEYKTCTSKVM